MKWPKIKITRGRQLLLLIVIASIIGIVWVSVSYSAKNRVVSSIEIRHVSSDSIPLMNDDILLKQIYKKHGNLIGRSAQEINISILESNLRRIDAIADVQVFVELNGTLKIKVLYRKPVVRVKNNQEQEFYIDGTGIKFMLNTLNPQDVLPASGFIPEPAISGKVKTEEGKELVILGTYVLTHPLWDADFEQCHVDNNGELILIPRVGNHTIEIGNTDFLDEKLENLRAYYKNGLNKIGWNHYTQLILKYKNQVVAKPAVLKN